MPTPAVIPDVPMDTRLRDTYASLAFEPGAYVSLARMRDALPDLSHAEFDQAIKDLVRNSDNVSLVPENNQKSLTLAQRNASIRFGGQDKHLISIFRT